MITKGKATTGRGLAAHLLKAENERVELWDISGTVARNINAAVDNWRAFALGTNCDKPLYHAQLNPSGQVTKNTRAQARRERAREAQRRRRKARFLLPPAYR